MTRKAPDETRERIVQAAVARILAHGATPLVLDTIAADAGVSKGGLLHHFPTKAALLEGILEALIRLFEGRFAQTLAEEPEGETGRWSRAYIRATFDPDPREPEFTSALARLLAAYPDFFRHYADAFTASFGDGDETLPAARALLIRTACDGWWLGELFATPLVKPDARAELRDELLRLTR